MTEALVLILGLVLFAVSGLVLLLPVGVALTLLYVFLMGDLFFELW